MIHNDVKNTRVAIIGAGCSGITALKNCLQVGIHEVVCYEQDDGIGGNWRYTADVGHSSVCETTHIISSKELSEYLDFPMPDYYPDYPSHYQVLQYFESYVEHFNLRSFIRLGHKVDKITREENGTWKVEGNGAQDCFDFILVANGHHSVPRMPSNLNMFSGKVMHSHSFKNKEPFRNKNVLVIGGGNSACDCAVECSRVAHSVDISMRRPHYIVPKFFLGKPTDSFNKKMLWLPKILANWLRKLTLRLQIGSYKDYGLEQPRFEVTQDHPTLNSELLYKIRHGKISPRKGIASIKEREITFADGIKRSYDIIIAATGYKIVTPFIDKNLLDFSDKDRVPLYLRMFHPRYHNLIFIGLVQPQGAVWPLSDLQSKLAANYIIGNYDLPKNVDDLAEKDADYIEREFLPGKRHSIEVHYHPYFEKLEKNIPKNAPLWLARKQMNRYG